MTRSPGSALRRPSVLILLVALMLGGAHPVQAAGGQSTMTAALDLPAMMITTNDLDELGFDQYLRDYSGLTPIEYETAFTARTLGYDQEVVEEALVDAGYEASYGSGFVRPYDLTEPLVRPVRYLNVYLWVLEDQQGARSIYELLSGSTSFVYEPLDVPDLGDVSAISYGEGEADALFGLAAKGRDLLFTNDRFVYEVVWTDYVGTPPTEDEMVDIGRRVLKRANAVLERESAGLGTIILPIAQADPATVDRGYWYLDGEAIRLADDSLEQVEERDERFSDAAVTNVLRQAISIQGAGLGENEHVALLTTLLEFESEEAADAAMGDIDSLVLGRSQVEDIEDPDPLSDVGDDAVVLVVTMDEGSSDWMVPYLVIEVDNLIVVLSVERIELARFLLANIEDLETMDPAFDVDLDALVELGEAQADCMQDRACPDAIALPDTLVDL